VPGGFPAPGTTYIENIFTKQDQFITSDEDLNPVVIDVADIGGGAGEDNVQSDWNQTDNEEDDFIKNKPTIPAAQVSSDWNATEGVEEILNKPAIPAAQIQSDWGQADDGVVDFIKNKPTLGTAAAKDVGTGADEVAAGNHTHSALHSHSNKSTLDKIGESGGVPTWDGSAWPGGGAAADQKIVFGTEITGDADITATSHKFKTTDVNKSTAVTLTLKKNVFAVGEWFVLVQTGDGQFELDCDAEVTVPDWNKSAGKGFEMYVYCVDATTDANVFRIVGGVE